MSENESPAEKESKRLSQLAYADSITSALLPPVTQLMDQYPPPDGLVATGVSGWIQALTLVQVAFCRTFGIPLSELAKALRLLADDLDAEVPVPYPSKKNAEPKSEWKVDF